MEISFIETRVPSLRSLRFLSRSFFLFFLCFLVICRWVVGYRITRRSVRHGGLHKGCVGVFMALVLRSVDTKHRTHRVQMSAMIVVRRATSHCAGEWMKRSTQ